MTDLPLLSRAFRRLQRIDRSRTSKSAALSWRLLRLVDHDVTAVRARNAALNHQQVLVFIHAQNPQVARRDPGVAHVARHPHALEHARRKCRRANRTRNLEHRTVRLGTTTKMMPLHHALKAVPLAGSDDIDKTLAFENIDQHAVANFNHTLGRLARSVHFHGNLTQKFHWRKIVLGKMSTHRLGQLFFFDKFDQADLRRYVTVFRLGLVLRNHARSRLQHRRRPHIALRIEELRHADLLAQNSRDSRHFRLRSQHGSPNTDGGYWLGVGLICAFTRPVTGGLSFKYSSWFFLFLNPLQIPPAINRRRAADPIIR